ncbi:MAG TPA: Arm DNA-binding domain-containing protein, partial [Beijerinckiaceae bacterium]|nr:Arm DNA-binding domain-containing protein [Beijerinckiaceae bacterium]
MSTELNRLSALKVAQLRKSGFYPDGLGLYLQVAPGGSKSWIFRYQRHNRPRKMGLGPLHTVGLAKAREKALAARAMLLDDIDPIDVRQEKRAAARAEPRRFTFKECSLKFIEANRPGWKSAKHAGQWFTTLETYAFPVIGDLPVDHIADEHVLKILDPLWSRKTETASRLRGRIEKVLDWAAFK